MDPQTQTTQKPAPRWSGKAQGIPLVNLRLEKLPPERIDAELAKFKIPTPLADELRPHIANLPGVGVVAQLPFFSWISSPPDIALWPAFELRGYPLHIAIDYCAGPENPLAEQRTRFDEMRKTQRALAAAAERQAAIARDWQEVEISWQRIGSSARLCFRAAATLPLGPAREALEALARGAIDEMLAPSGASAPSLDERSNALIRALGREVAERTRPRPERVT
jgi:hypothetical protein